MEQCIDEISKGMYNCMFYQSINFKNYDFTYSIMPWIRRHFYFAETILPSDVIENPDKYLQPGDIISVPIGTQFYKKAHHFAIYIGNKQVAHVSGHGRKAESVARIGNFRTHFVGKNKIVKKLVFSYKIREPEKIVEIAKDFAEKGYRKGMYSMALQNCQHFVTLCALGFEFSPEISELAFFLTWLPPYLFFIFPVLLSCVFIVQIILTMLTDQNFILNDSPSNIIYLWLSNVLFFHFIFIQYDVLKNIIPANEPEDTKDKVATIQILNRILHAQNRLPYSWFVIFRCIPLLLLPYSLSVLSRLILLLFIFFYL